jgi:hypothetical protein
MSDRILQPGTFATVGRLSAGRPGRFWRMHFLETEIDTVGRLNMMTGVFDPGTPVIVIQHDTKMGLSHVLSHLGLVWIYTDDLQ